jgi:hypothetical protein
MDQINEAMASVSHRMSLLDLAQSDPESVDDKTTILRANPPVAGADEPAGTGT